MKTALFFKISLGIILSLFISAGISSNALAQKKPKHAYKKSPQHPKAHVTHKPNHYYAHLPKRGAVVKVTPSGTVVVKHAGVNFYFHKGVWYKPKGGAYVVAMPAPGVKIKVLPVKRRKIVIEIGRASCRERV